MKLILIYILSVGMAMLILVKISIIPQPESWEHNTTEVEVLRHLSRTCQDIFHGDYTISGDKKNGWRIYCNYQKPKQVG